MSSVAALSRHSPSPSTLKVKVPSLNSMYYDCNQIKQKPLREGYAKTKSEIELISILPNLAKL